MSKINKFFKVFYQEEEVEYDDTIESQIYITKKVEDTKVEEVKIKEKEILTEKVIKTKPVDYSKENNDLSLENVEKAPVVIAVKPSVSKKNIETNEVKQEVISPNFRKEKYKFFPPLSPIYGIIDGNQEEQTQKKHSYVSNIENKPSKIGTIISPLYGCGEPTNNSEKEFVKPEKENNYDESVLSLTLDDVLKKDDNKKDEE